MSLTHFGTPSLLSYTHVSKNSYITPNRGSEWWMHCGKNNAKLRLASSFNPTTNRRIHSFSLITSYWMPWPVCLTQLKDGLPCFYWSGDMQTFSDQPWLKPLGNYGNWTNDTGYSPKEQLFSHFLLLFCSKEINADDSIGNIVCAECWLHNILSSPQKYKSPED